MAKRIRQQFLLYDGRVCSKVHGPRNSVCECNILFSVNSPLFPHAVKQIILRLKDNVARQYTTMLEEYLMFVASQYSLIHGVVEKIEGNKDIITAIQSISMNVGPNQFPVPSPFPGSIPMSTTYTVNTKIIDVFRQWDRKYFKTYLKVDKPYEWWLTRIWKEYNKDIYIPGTQWDDLSDLSLLERSLRMRSFYNIGFTGLKVNGKIYNHSVYAQEGLYPIKISKLLDKYNKSTHTLPSLFAQNKQIVLMGLDMMVKDEGWDEMFKSVEWSYDKAISEVLKVTMSASGGIRPGYGKVVIRDGIVTHITVNGKKMEQILYSAQVIDKAVQHFYETGNLVLPQGYHKIVIKSEIHHANSVEEEELRRVAEKAREYFIPDLITILLSQLTQGYRQKIERGNLIRIGMDWNHGGMYEFAKYMLYDDPDMRWITFDISGCDTSIINVFLEMYSLWAAQYHKFSDEIQAKLYKALLKESTKRLCVKLTNMLGDVWRLITGLMPSGAFETSHGDSWIVSLVFYCMFAYYLVKDIKFRRLFNLHRKKKRLSVYGDDDVFGFHKDLTPWFTKENVTYFFLNFANFTIRDFEYHETFLSTIGFGGELSHKGVCFLQKYAVSTPAKYLGIGVPPVVHFRPCSVNMRKFAKGCGDFKTDLDYFLAAVTGVYDNYFNQVWCDACLFFCKSFKQEDGWQERMMDIIKKSHGYVTRMMRKCQLDLETVKKGYPSFEMLMDLTLPIPEHHRNKYRDVWTMNLLDLI